MHLRVLTLNVLNLEGDPRRQEVLNAELRRLNPDLLSLQEVIQRPGRDQLAELLDGTGLQGTHQFEAQSAIPPWAERYGGTAVATRWPHRVLEVADMRVDGAGDVHPWAALAVAVDVPGEGELLLVGTTHSARFDGEAARERQAVALTDLADRHRRALPTILAGDFNATPDTSSIRYLTGRQSLDGRSVYYHDAWEVAGDGPGCTWTYENPLAAEIKDLILGQPGDVRRIDYVFVGSVESHLGTRARIERAVVALNQTVDGLWPSDHFGVLVDLDVQGDAPIYEPGPPAG